MYGEAGSGPSAGTVLRRALAGAAFLLLAACGSDSGGPEKEPEAAGQRYPDVLAVELTPSGETWDATVTVSSPYDSPERYADGWRVLAPDGTVLGVHELAHDHASEQPFTRTQSGLGIPAGVERITVEGRDLENGYGGQTVTVPVERE